MSWLGSSTRIAPRPRPRYVPSLATVVAEVVQEITTDPTAFKKHLLFGARGGGKSTQLHEINRRLNKLTRLDIDLDAMGVGVAGITAFDLLYILGVAGLARLPKEQAREREDLYTRLHGAYSGSGGTTTRQKAEEAIDGLAGFAGAMTGVAAAIGATIVPVGAVAVGLTAAGKGLRLRSQSAGVVAAASQQGRELQEAARAIFRAIRAIAPPIVVLIDGLEKVNGQAAQWFRDTFENTRLLLDAEVTMVVAAPPCPFSHTNSANRFGYVTHVLYGYGVAFRTELTEILRRRVEGANLDPDAGLLRVACERFAVESGGHPRYAVSLLKRAVQRAVNDNRGELRVDDLDEAVKELRRFLALGLTEPSYKILGRVSRIAELPDNDMAAQLFADGRILADPPDETGAPTFKVHPLIEPALVRYQKRVQALEAEDAEGE